MAAVAEGPWHRVLRPLLAVPRARLRATLAARGQGWVEDPSNRNPAFARVRMRALAGTLEGEGLNPSRLAATAGRMARARAALEGQMAELAARAVTLHDAGWAELDRGAWAVAPEEIRLRLLAALLRAVGGEDYVPRLERLERLADWLAAGQGGVRTLGGCRVAVAGASVVVGREAARMQGRLRLDPGSEVVWDRRFRLVVRDDAPSGLWVGPLAGYWRTVAERLGRALPKVPAGLRATLPAILTEDGISAVPHLGYNRQVLIRTLRAIAPWPAHCLTGAGTRLV
jgi:tRNA(Ile)-lysidine synthase